MQKFQLLSPSEQVAHHLRGLLQQGRWTKLMPGTVALSKELPGVDRKAIGSALQILVKEGWLKDQGIGKQRKILKQPERRGNKLFRVGFIRLVSDGDHRLESALVSKFSSWKGVTLTQAPKTIIELERSVYKISQMILSMQLDAWIVPAASREILEWFKDSGIPVYAVFGRHSKLKMDGFSFDATEGIKALASKLIALGHKRVTWIARKEQRQPALGNNEKVFFEQLSEHGIRPNSFTLPEWEETPEGFQDLLDSLFKVTPPTALIIPETYLVQTTFQYFLKKRIQVPDQVSIMCTEDCEEFKWANPSIARISRDFNLASEAVSEWIEMISSGRPAPMQKTFYPVEFIEGGTLAKPRK